MQEQTTQGSFLPEGRQDILNTALGRPEHPGRVRTAGVGVTIGQYFGRDSRGSTTSSISAEELRRLTQHITVRVTQDITQRVTQDVTERVTHDVTQRLLQQFGSQLGSFGSQPVPPVDVDAAVAARVSTKGSCAAPSTGTAGTQPSADDPCTDIPDRCELCVDEVPPRVVALGRVHEGGGSTIHHVPLTDDLVRVVVEEVRDADAQVPIPTSEVQLVGQALNTFIPWPRHLVRAVSVQVFPLLIFLFVNNLIFQFTLFTNILFVIIVVCI